MCVRYTGTANRLSFCNSDIGHVPGEKGISLKVHNCPPFCENERFVPLIAIGVLSPHVCSNTSRSSDSGSMGLFIEKDFLET